MDNNKNIISQEDQQFLNLLSKIVVDEILNQPIPNEKESNQLLKDYGLLTEIKKGQVLTLDPLGDDNAPSTEPLLELLTLLNSIA